MKILHKSFFASVLISMLALQGCGTSPTSTEQVGSEPELVGSAPMEKGQDGRDGKDGADGRDGKDGADGQNGEKGETGNTGPQGATGAQGIPGKTGQTGNDGIMGPQGVQGIPGTPGKDATAASITLEDLLPPMPTSRRAVEWERYYQLRHVFGQKFLDTVDGTATLCGYPFTAANIGSFNRSEDRVIYNEQDVAVGLYFGVDAIHSGIPIGNYSDLSVSEYYEPERITLHLYSGGDTTAALVLSDAWGCKLYKLTPNESLTIEMTGGLGNTQNVTATVAIIAVREENGELVVA